MRYNKHGVVSLYWEFEIRSNARTKYETLGIEVNPISENSRGKKN